ncbi:hypothetical protein FUA23_10390 [Neolewinella aurantiaca]|uniref:Uncharacterized protein n=1 Tax=Neolewinella aurantiaca TaxID=2602767 RepID=A0A5C7FF24_9BACT|nr:hypothetical protein [Neolewinella aurantiaca]TXF89368.1 hypothetical protein FUA23_10390 [Neolewinella aurantiaca]
MYRFFYLLTVILITILCLYIGLAWWAHGLAALILALLFPVWKRSGFWLAFIAGVMVWGIYTSFLHLDSEGRLTDRLAVTFGVGNGWGLVLITALWGGITAGLGGWFGTSLRKTLKRSHLADAKK